jgi:hypothetical protein
MMALLQLANSAYLALLAALISGSVWAASRVDSGR